jgi:hypothetical protein
LLGLVAACGGAGDDDAKGDAAHAYILGSLVFGPEGTTSYVSVLDDLTAQTIDYEQAQEFTTSADVWVQGGAVYVANADDLTITRYQVSGHGLVVDQAVGFASYGVTDFGFWRNTFVAEDKAYFTKGTTQLIVWNPQTMQITGTVDLPALPARDGFMAFPGYSDRAAVVRGGTLYQPVYWTTSDYFSYTPDSQIAVIDVATDQVTDVIDAPCPGLDYGSADAAGNLYFSSWIYAAGGAAVLAQPSTCVFEVPADGSAPHVAMTFADVTGGSEGAALRFLPDGRALFSVLEHDKVVADPNAGASAVTFGANWRFWTSSPTATDPGAGAAPLDSIDWSTGAQYSFDIDDRNYMLVAAGDYSQTTVYDLGNVASPATLFDTMGWSTRLFKLR